MNCLQFSYPSRHHYNQSDHIYFLMQLPRSLLFYNDFDLLRNECIVKNPRIFQHCTSNISSKHLFIINKVKFYYKQSITYIRQKPIYRRTPIYSHTIIIIKLLDMGLEKQVGLYLENEIRKLLVPDHKLKLSFKHFTLLTPESLLTN